MNLKFSIDTSTFLIIACFDSKIPAKSAAALLKEMTSHKEDYNVLAAVYTDGFHFKNGYNDEIFEYSRKILTILEKGE